MSDLTQPQAAVGQPALASVVPLFTELVLDTGAVQAERLALLAELVAEQFHHAGSTQFEADRSALLMAAWHVERAAHLTRAAADRERARCATADGRPRNDHVPSGLTARSVPALAPGVAPDCARPSDIREAQP